MTSPLRHCSECGKEIPPNTTRCVHCGAQIPSTVSEPGATNASGASAEPTRGLFTLLRTGGGPFNIGAVGKVIAKAIGKPLSDVTRQLSASRGILAEKIDGAAAQQIVPRLHELGVECLAAPVERIPVLPDIEYLREGRFTRSGLKCAATTWDGWRLIERPWSDVALVTCTVLVTERVRIVDLGGGLLLRKQQVQTDILRKTILDLFMRNPWCQLRIEEAIPSPEVGPAARPTHPLSYLRMVAKQTLEVTPPVNVNEGVRLLASAAPESAFQPLVFSTRRDIDQYNLWLLTLLEFGLPLPA